MRFTYPCHLLDSLCLITWSQSLAFQIPQILDTLSIGSCVTWRNADVPFACIGKETLKWVADQSNPYLVISLWSAQGLSTGTEFSFVTWEKCAPPSFPWECWSKSLLPSTTEVSDLGELYLDVEPGFICWQQKSVNCCHHSWTLVFTQMKGWFPQTGRGLKILTAFVNWDNRSSP